MTGRFVKGGGPTSQVVSDGLRAKQQRDAQHTERAFGL